jgi:ATPase family associated with various cellular activities (AAA)
MNKKQEFLSPKDLESQEHLSVDSLSKFDTDFNYPTNDPRPSANFIDLMNWTIEHFRSCLKDQDNLNKFVQNRIIIDGQFMEFCHRNKITVDILYKDSIISWKTEHDFEKYFVQGVFLIKAAGLEFLHAALFHKGNQNEDEVSFFVIVSDKNYEAYIKLRNKFDAWVQERDRSNSHIRVVEGDDIPYTKDQSWDDLFLPPEIKKELKSSVENFLSSKDFYLKNKLPWKRGIILFGKPGNGKTSIIRTIISEYDFKPVTIVAGANDDAVREAFSYAEEQSPSLLYFEDLDSLLEKSVDISTLLNLLDGVSAKNGLLVIATANEIKKLKANITQRPSRFDRKFEIPPPSLEMAYIYLKSWFSKVITLKKCRELAKFAVKHELSYAYLKELYISAMFEALSHNRKAPTAHDIDNAINRLIKDKNAVGGNVISTDKYFK